MAVLLRVVFDANVWVSAAAFAGPLPRQAISAARQGIVQSVISEDIIHQVLRALRGPKIGAPPRIVTGTESQMRSVSALIVPTTRLTVITAKDSDNRILECAVDGRADLIVTGDRKHLLPLDAYAGIRIVTPAEFVATLSE